MREALAWTDMSEHLQPPQVVQVHDAVDGAGGVGDDYRRDLVRLHDLQRLDREEAAAES